MADKPNLFDWKALEQWLGGQLPFLPQGFQQQMRQGENWVESYVKNMLDNTLNKRGGDTGLAHEQFETHSDVIVRITVPDSLSVRSLRLLCGPRQLKLEGLPSGTTQSIELPCPVLFESARAVYKRGVLQVRMPKEIESDFLQEIPIRIAPRRPTKK
ncbi:hypothetical protein J31TS4_14040 [Paenibacillus sp. J31TS4]|uniref:Hsp20/alpha crystallin family protein n=1 Tax=Paenibacillus sp. J31TS4 TaxID=2807195 RepID=UPI001B2B0558|nr:Hsp20/alpha crystallin family protein [Paenibacillus sp. J31TS4]GIP38124.1 hypothetical protein J31TS4_14040 [Paenibacillus sp. J31TS4]